MKAWIENDRIRDICHGNPVELYHPDVAVFYDTDVPANAENGDGWVDGKLVKPELPAPVDPPAATTTYPKVSPIRFMMLFTSTERIFIRAAVATDPVIADWWSIVNDPRLTEVDMGLASVQGALDYLTSESLLAEGRKDQILTGVVA